MTESPEAFGLSLFGHLAELRRRLIVSALVFAALACAAYIWFDPVYRFFAAPFHLTKSSVGETLLVMSPLEGIMTRMKLSAYVGLVLSTPVHVWNLIRFVFPGLRPAERRLVLGVLAASSALLIGAGLYAYKVLLPLSLGFLLSPNVLPGGVGVLLSYDQSLFLVFRMMVYAMLAFQFPIVLLLHYRQQEDEWSRCRLLS